VFDPDVLKAIVFDLDGTLYRQEPLRRAMLVRLLRGHALRPLAGLKTMRVLGAYRRAQEHLRECAVGDTEPQNVSEAQLQLACEWTNVEPGFARQCVERWMEEAPLPLLARHVWPGLTEFLRACKARGIRLGVLSDYPAAAKLEALAMGDHFDVVVTAQSPDVGVFKPHPRGLLVTLERLAVRPLESLYVGDRAEVDAAAARAAGVQCVIVGKQLSYLELQQQLFGTDGAAAAVAAQPSLHRR
jgi:HAD superfamily hydrolase (TIGR01509 family)